MRRVPDVRRDGEHVGIAFAQDIGVEERAVGKPEIGEQPAVAIPPLDVELELDRLVAETAGGELGRPAAHRLDRRLRPVAAPRVAIELRGVVRLGRVDADQADAFDPRAEPDVDRVAIDDVHDAAAREVPGANGSDGGRARDERCGQDDQLRPVGQRAIPSRSWPTIRATMAERPGASGRPTG